MNEGVKCKECRKYTRKDGEEICTVCIYMNPYFDSYGIGNSSKSLTNNQENQEMAVGKDISQNSALPKEVYEDLFLKFQQALSSYEHSEDE